MGSGQARASGGATPVHKTPKSDHRQARLRTCKESSVKHSGAYTERSPAAWRLVRPKAARTSAHISSTSSRPGQMRPASRSPTEWNPRKCSESCGRLWSSSYVDGPQKPLSKLP